MTYDNDATYFDNDKRSAEYSYQKSKQFSGLTGCIAELGMNQYVRFPTRKCESADRGYESIEKGSGAGEGGRKKDQEIPQ